MPAKRQGRWFNFLKPKQPVVVLGTEMAAAIAAEKVHSESRVEPSPLADISYGTEEGDLFRFKESRTDEVVSALVEEWHLLTARELSSVRASLTMDDFYTLLTFARRSALLALRKRSSSYAVEGLKAIGVIDAKRIDWRDASWAAALDSFAINVVDPGATENLETIAAKADADISEILIRFRQDPATSLSDWGFRIVETGEGPVLAQDNGRPYSPTADLLAVARDITAVLEADVWRVRGVTTGSDLPKIWLAESDSTQVGAATNRLRGCVSVNAELNTAEFDPPETQHLLAFIAQAANSDDAETIAQAAGPGAKKWFVPLGVSHGDLCAVLVSRSIQQGVASFESSLERFRSGVLEAIRETR